jgi:diguanylate cyclase (GGDEF)-like protein
MFSKILNLIRSFLSVSVPDNCKEEFEIGINRINISRAKITAATFIFLETLQLAALFIIKKEGFLKKPVIYYGVMYTFLLLVMIVYLLIFVKLGNNIPEHGRGIRVAGISFISAILLWCAGISLLDQLSSGQVIVYTVAIISIAITPFFGPVTLLIVYLSIHALFLAFMPYFQKSGEMLFGNFINSTTFLIISWAISYMRYKKQAEDFNNRRIIQEKSDELNRINKELEAANRKLEKLSQTDSLTGVFNRFMFDRTVKAEWNRCKRHFLPLSLIMIDIDFFKAFNDNYGHQTGDDCIRRVAEVLSACAKRSSDVVTRYGGEEFAIILPHMENENALELAEKMRIMVEELAIPHAYSCISEYATISLGVNTIIPSDKSSVEEYIRTADKALYEAKKFRNNIVVA